MIKLQLNNIMFSYIDQSNNMVMTLSGLFSTKYIYMPRVKGKTWNIDGTRAHLNIPIS